MNLRSFFCVLILLTISTFPAAAQAVAIGTDGSAPDTSAMLDVKSIRKGLLVPRMLANQKTGISLPATGLLIYQTEAPAGFYYNTGTPALPNWQLMGATGPGFVNGTASGQIYLTGLAAPYAPQVPQSVTGDVSISGNAVTTIGSNAITTAKLADNAVTNAKIANNSIAVGKINATGTASSGTYLRGDGAWAAAGGAGMALVAISTEAQTIAAGGATAPPTTISFQTVQTLNSVLGTFTSNNAFKATTAGVYQITVNVCGSANFGIFPLIFSNNTIVAYGVGVANSFLAAPVSRSSATITLSLAVNDVITIKANVASSSTAQPVSIDGSTRLSIIKL